jgi:AraC family transcriptional regulator
VLDYVEAHLADSKALSLPALAQVVALSEYHFARMFHQHGLHRA